MYSRNCVLYIAKKENVYNSGWDFWGGGWASNLIEMPALKREKIAKSKIGLTY